MKIIDARNGSLQSIPFALGQSGRGRWLEDVKISNRPGQAPAGPEDVGYCLFGQEKKHVILTKADGKQRGILLRVSTAGCYTKGSCGRVSLKGGKATLLTEGTWAEGDAGRIANGPDQLWHVEGPSVFVINLQGGAGKGYGLRYLVVTKSFRTVMIERDDLCQIIAVDDDPEAIETVRQFAGDLHEDVQAALKVADELEEVADEPIAAVTHFVSEFTAIGDVLARWNIAIPAAFNGVLGGVSGVQSGTIMPGTKALLATSVGGGGGRRYGYTILIEEGLTRIASEVNNKHSAEEILAVADATDWRIAFESRKDGVVVDRVLINAGGTHSYNPEPDSRWNESMLTTAPWPGHEPKSPSVSELAAIFKTRPAVGSEQSVAVVSTSTPDDFGGEEMEK